MSDERDQEWPEPGAPLLQPGEAMCGRCFDVVPAPEIRPANCDERPEARRELGMYHCPDCGAMVLGGYTHPPLCARCHDRKHPAFDEVGDTL